MKSGDETWQGYTREDLGEMDDLAHDLVQTDFDRVVRDGWCAEDKTKHHALASSEELVIVFLEGGGSYPIEYNRDELVAADSYEDVVEARGGPRGRQ